MPRFSPWVEDAADIQSDAVMRDFRDNVLQETNAIREYLDSERSHRDTKFLVSAPKGFGKTLLIQTKRLLIQQNRRGTLLLPEQSLVDRPSGRLRILSQDEIKKKYTDYDYWVMAWLMAIVITTLKNFNPSALDDCESEIVHTIKQQTGMVTITTSLNTIIFAQDTDFYAQGARDYALRLDPHFRKIDRPVAFFLDNIDEHFESSQELRSPEFVPIVYRNRNRLIWQQAQIALVRAIRDLDGINSHVKIFAPIRREAFLSARRFDSTAMQLSNKTVDLIYSDEDLFHIFKKNIEMERDDNLICARSTNPLEKFFGTNNLRVQSYYTNRQEGVFDFVLRHTLRRPRDLMAIGGRLSRMGPKERADTEKMKAAVFQAASKTSLDYMEEMGRFITIPHEDLFRLIGGNVFRQGELDKISEEYQNLEEIKSKEFTAQPFSSLYRIGLLGEVSTNRWGQKVQKFLTPNDFVFDRDDRTLPESELFLIHPSLDEYINGRHGGDYFGHFDTNNIVGHEKDWADAQVSQFVLRGDLAGYSDIMHDVNYAHIYPGLFREWVGLACKDLDCVEPSDGDGLLIVHHHARSLLDAVRVLHRRSAGFELSKSFRFGGATGPIFYEQWPEGQKPKVPMGIAIRIASRLEPLGRQFHGNKAEKSILVVTERFMCGLDEDARREYKAREIEQSEIPGLRSDENGFIVVKSERDPPIHTKLWVLEIA